MKLQIPKNSRVGQLIAPQAAPPLISRPTLCGRAEPIVVGGAGAPRAGVDADCIVIRPVLAVPGLPGPNSGKAKRRRLMEFISCSKNVIQPDV